MDPATRELIQKLLSRIDILENRVSELEHNAPTRAAAPSSSVAGRSASVARLCLRRTAKPRIMDHDQAPVPEGAQPTYPTLKISGFGDVDYSATDLRGTPAGFQPLTLLGSPGGFELGPVRFAARARPCPPRSAYSANSVSQRGRMVDSGLRPRRTSTSSSNVW